jgi:dipeptidase E
MELLLLSNSRTAAGFLVDYVEEIRAFARGARRACFIPYASVMRPWEEFTAMVREALPFDFQQDISQAEVVVVGGGNTFQLLLECRRRGLLEPIERTIRAGAKYIGWSAGSNLACPTIKTTNDMPIVDPGGLEALGLVPFQINPHYTNATIPGHQGETRDQRLIEFARVNPRLPVLGLPEGDWLRVSGSTVELHGPHPAVWFSGAASPTQVGPGPLQLNQPTWVESPRTGTDRRGP